MVEALPRLMSVERPARFPTRSIRKLLKLRLLIFILVSSAVLRIILVWNGGARFFPDEGRYGLAFKGLLALGNGHIRQSLRFLMLGGAHQFFPLLSLGPALIHSAAIVLVGWPLLDYRLAASVFSFASVVVIGLIYALARKAGGDETEALFAALFGRAPIPCSIFRGISCRMMHRWRFACSRCCSS